MESFAELGELVRGGERDWKQYGEVNATYWEGLILFNYSFRAEITNRWNWFERVSRGLILDEKTGELVALCMERFWNYLQIRGNVVLEISSQGLCLDTTTSGKTYK